MERLNSEMNLTGPSSVSTLAESCGSINGSSLMTTSNMANSSTISSSSSSNSSISGPGHNISGSVSGRGAPHQRSRFGSLFRSLINDSADSTLSPNTVRGLVNPFRSQLGLAPLELSRMAKSPEIEPNSLNTSPPVLSTEISSTLIPNECHECLMVPSLPFPPDLTFEQIPPTPDFSPPILQQDHQNIIPKTNHSIAAVVPAHPLKQNNYLIIGTPVGSKNNKEICPPSASPSIKQKLHSRPGKKLKSGWKFANEMVGGKEYLLMKQLGKGGCGEVSLVMEKVSRELFALKRVNLCGLGNGEIKECVNEVKLLVELKDTDLVIHIEAWEMNENEKTIKIVMEFGQCDLSKSINLDKIVSLNKVKFIWERMLYIVQSIHQKGIVHADLKPANFVWVGGNLKIIDFGIANKLQTDYTSIATANPKGTLNFISPETVNQDAFGRTKISPKSDIWSLGCILHFMVYGQTPFQSITHQMAKINAIIKGVNSYPPLPSEFEGSSVLSVLQLCFQVDPKKRATATELLTHSFLQEPR